MVPSVLQEGSLFAGRYRLVRNIASGGMGSVYEVLHVQTERRLALKVMLPHALVSEQLRERFEREAKVAASVRSEHIVDVLDAGFDAETKMPFLVMELLEGEDLRERLLRLGRFTANEVVEHFTQIAAALDRVHKRSIVHRDLKPENLFLTARDDGTTVVKILDFGVAKVLAEGLTSAGTGDPQGTPLYMSPEQFTAEIKVSPATDVYALGMLAYTLLVGMPYWGRELTQGMNIFVLARLAEAGPKEPASKRAAEHGVALSSRFDHWFATATAPSPSDRFRTAGEAVRALTQALSDHDFSNPPPPPPLPTGVDAAVSVTSAALEDGRVSPTPPSSTAPLRKEPAESAVRRYVKPALFAAGIAVLAGAAAARLFAPDPPASLASATTISAPTTIETPIASAAPAAPSNEIAPSIASGTPTSSSASAPEPSASTSAKPPGSGRISPAAAGRSPPVSSAKPKLYSRD